MTSRSDREYGKRLQHDVPDDAVNDGDRADAERQGERRSEGKPGCLRQGADAIHDVAPHILEPSKGPGVALQLFDLFDTPEGARRGDARLLGRQSSSFEFALQLPEMSINLAGELVFGAPVSEYGQQT